MESDNVLRIDQERKREIYSPMIVVVGWVDESLGEAYDVHENEKNMKKFRGQKQVLLIFEQIIAFTLHLSTSVEASEGPGVNMGYHYDVVKVNKRGRRAGSGFRNTWWE